MVPTDATVSQATSRANVCDASAPSTATKLPASASGSSTGCATRAAESPGPAGAKSPNTTPCTRRMA